MALISTLLIMPGHRRANSPMQLPNTRRGAVPGGITFALAADAVAIGAGQTWAIPGGVPAQLSGGGGPVLAISTVYYCVFCLPGSGQLQAIAQDQWAGLLAATDVCPVCYLEDHYDLILPIGTAAVSHIAALSDGTVKALSLWVNVPGTNVAALSDGNVKALSLWANVPGTNVAAQSDGNTKAVSLWNPLSVSLTVTEPSGAAVTRLSVTGQPDQLLGALALDLWNGSSNNTPPAGWQNPGGDGGFAAAATAVTNAGPTGYWTSPTPADSSQQILFRQHFTLPAGVIGPATLYFSPGCRAVAGFINGVSIANFQSSGTPYSIDGSHLVPGQDNVFACQVAAGSPPAGPYAWVGFQLVIQYA